RTVDDLHWLPGHTPDPVVLGDAERNLSAGSQEHEGVGTQHHHDRALLAPVEPLLPMDAAVLARGDVVADLLLIVNHDSVGAAVDPAVIRVTGDVEAARAQIATAVSRMPFRSWEFEQVYVVPGHDVFHDRAVLHDLRRNGPQ